MANSLHLIAAIMPVFAPHGATQGDTIELRATVATICSIDATEIVAGREDQVRIVTNCNAQDFRLQFSGTLPEIVETEAIGATPAHFHDAVALRSHRPGRIDVVVTFERPLDEGDSVGISLQTL